MVQFTAARLREYGKDWELSRMWLCDDYMIMASNEFDLKSLNLHLVLQNTGFNQSQLVVVLRVLSQQIQTIKVITEFGPQVFQLKQPILLKDFWTHFSGHENLILPLFSLVVVFGFRCWISGHHSAKQKIETQCCGSISVHKCRKKSIFNGSRVQHWLGEVKPVCDTLVYWCLLYTVLENIYTRIRRHINE